MQDSCEIWHAVSTCLIISIIGNIKTKWPIDHSNPLNTHWRLQKLYKNIFITKIKKIKVWSMVHEKSCCLQNIHILMTLKLTSYRYNVSKNWVFKIRITYRDST